MEKKIALVIGCIILYVLFYIAWGPIINVILFLGLVSWWMYKYN